MRMYALLTPSHINLFETWFKPTLRDAFEVVTIRQSQECTESTYKSPGWCQTTRRKVEMVIDIIQAGQDPVFILTDVDLQFFAPLQDAVANAVADVDIAFQRNSPWGEACTGFLVCRSNERTLKFWRRVLATMQARDGYDDQDAANMVLQPLRWRLKHALTPWWRWAWARRLTRACADRWSKPIHVHAGTGVRWSLLPDTFYNPQGVHWKPGTVLALPPNILLHHANWCVGLEHKHAQLQAVQQALHLQAAA